MSTNGPEEKRLSPVVAVVGFVIVALIAFLAGYFIAKPPSLKDVKDSSAELAKATIDSEALPVRGSPAKGEHTAPVTMVVFGDFQCNASRGTADAVVNQAVREYGANTVRVVWKHLPLSIHPDARMAAQAAWAAGQQGKFWEYHDVIFANFPTDRSDAKAMQEKFGTFLKPDKLLEYAVKINLDKAKFQADMTSPEAVAAVGRDLALAERLGLSSTPSIYINGRRVSFKQGVTYEAVKTVLDQELKRANELMKTPNAYYAFAVWANRDAADGIKVETLARLEDRPGAVEAGGAVGTAQGAAPQAPQRAAEPAQVVPPRPQRVGNPLGPDVTTLPRKGAASPKVTIIEFSEFECPFCSKVKPTIAQIMEAYPNDVQIAFAQFPLDFHKNAHLAGQASLAAHEQGKFWEYHDILFANQRQLSRQDLERYAEQVGLNMARFRQDLDSGRFAEVVDQQMADGQVFGISGTPSFLINGRKFVGAQPFDNFKTAIDEEIARADKVANERGLSGVALYRELVRTAPKEAPPQRPDQPVDEGRMMVDLGDSPTKGDPNAPVTIVEFTDFECPFCSKATDTLNELVEKNPGKVRVVFKHFPLDFHKNAPLAHRASIAAGQQGKFWEYHDVLFANHRALQRENLLAYAAQIGLDMNRFTADLDNPALDNAINADKAAGAKVAVRGTPHFFINGVRFSGAQPITAFQAALDRELKVADEFLKKGVPAAKIYETVIREAKTAPEAPKPVVPEGPIVVDIAGAPFKGPAKAPITIIEFSEFECPFCSKVNPTIDQLMQAYPNQIKVVFKHLPLDFHANAHLAAQASLAAHDQGKFWEYHDLLFANQRQLGRADLERYAEQLGLNMAKFREALDTGRFKERVDADLKDARSAGLSGTPSFLINGKKFVGAQPYDNFKKEVDEALANLK